MDVFAEIITWVCAFGVATLCVGMHIKALRLAQNIFKDGRPDHPHHVFRGTAFILLLHMAEIAVFGLLFYISCEVFQFGALSNAETLKDYMYFSAASYTSLGFGDLAPVGPIRLFAGVEALIGLTMIGWTAVFTYRHVF